MTYKHIEVPQDGKKISYKEGQIQVSDHPIVGLIEGDGIGTDITPVMLKVIDKIVDKAYSGKKSIKWMEIYAGEKANGLYGEYLPRKH